MRGDADGAGGLETHSLFKSKLLNVTVGAQAKHLLSLAAFSLAINVLYLSSSIYMMQIYDRVIPGGRVETLVLVTLILVLALATLSGLEVVRGYMLVRLSMKLDRMVSARLLDAALRGLRGSTEDRSQIIRDFDTFRGFVTGSGISALLDAPWFPVYIIVLFVLHPILAGVALIGIAIIAGLAVWTDKNTSAPTKKAGRAAARSYLVADEAVRNREVVAGLRMRTAMVQHWLATRRDMLLLSAYASDRSALFGSGGKLFRMLMQSSMLCFGSFLVIKQELTPGAMIACSILMGRALAPVEAAINASKQFSSARDAVARVDDLLTTAADLPQAVKLPPPQGKILVEKLAYAPAQDRPLILKGLTFEALPGECLSIIGPSASGKTTLAKIISGCVRPSGGTVRLDHADLQNWDDDQLQKALGYLPQEVVLFQGTVRQNIARFTEATDEDVVAAAVAANAHELILGLPQGYNTPIMDGGAQLSGGQRQRIGLARALFGAPQVIVLDEPNSNLDADGEQALAKTLTALKQSGRTVILVSHRPATLTLSDKLMLLREGKIEMFGPTTDVLARFKQMKDAASGSRMAMADVAPGATHVN
ncbi:MAG: type I secretion system permease/ATPase [Solirubrobacterales bacterium]